MKNRNEKTDSKPDGSIKIKTIHLIEYNALDKFGKVELGVIESNCLKKYDNKANLIELINFNKEEQIIDTYNYEFANDKIVLETYTDTSNSRWNYEIQYNYDSQWKLMEEIKLDSNTKMVYKIISSYDSESNLIEKNEYDGNGYLKFRTTYQYIGGELKLLNKYTADGIKSSIINYHYFDSNILREMYEYYYNSAGVQVDLHQTQYNENGLINSNLESRCSIIENYFYNEYGLLIQFTRSSEAGNIENYSYEYDLHGNWSKKTHYRNEMPFLITTREIEYY